MTLDPVTRAACAEALAGASAETLREDAAWTDRQIRAMWHDYASQAHPQPASAVSRKEDVIDARLRRLAALALAVAEMEERAPKIPVWWEVLWHDARSPAVDDPAPDTLPAALAHLIARGRDARQRR